MTILLSFLTYGPYHLARFVAAEKIGRAVGVTVRGLAMSARDSDYSWKTESAEGIYCAAGDIPLDEVRADDWRRFLEPIVDEIRPDVCAIAGYSHPAMLTLIAICSSRSIPWILMSDSREVDLPRARWREWSKGRIVKLASSGFAAGETHIDYLEKLGLSKENCSTGYDVVDNHFFAIEAGKWRSEASAGNGENNGPPRHYFLASSRFIAKKNLFRLLDAYALYLKGAAPIEDANKGPWDFCLLGDGTLRARLLTHAATLGLDLVQSAPWEPIAPAQESRPGRLFLPGFRQIRELPRFYANAGAFVHSSTTEQWGLVVNEAMASGLPVIVSNSCGCAPELVLENVNGFKFDPYNVAELAGLMEKLAAMSEADRSMLGRAAEGVIADWGLERFANGLITAGGIAMKSAKRRANFLDRILLHFLSRR